MSEPLTSGLAWLDTSERDRQKMMDAIQLFREPGTLDELGIGTVRDAFADLLFPGTSTIQTRARYFFFVPWVYLGLETKGVTSSDIAARARREEGRIMEALASNVPDEVGIIGRDAGYNVRRLPSNIYWRGLALWGLRLYSGSQAQYHRWLDDFHAINQSIRRRNRENRSLGDGGEREMLRHNWRPTIPPPPDDFPQNATLDLREVEAHFLREQIVHHLPHSLLAYLVEYTTPQTHTMFPWEHPQLAHLPAARREELFHARNFSEVIHGATLLYNYMLAEKAASAGAESYLLDDYAARLTEWAGMLEARRDAHVVWDWQRRFWALVTIVNPHIRPTTQAFIESWLALALEPGAARAITTNRAARRLISERERALKRHLARLHNPRALELWSGASSAGQLDYRWNVVQTLLDDILTAFHDPQGENDAAA